MFGSLPVFRVLRSGQGSLGAGFPPLGGRVRARFENAWARLKAYRYRAPAHAWCDTPGSSLAPEVAPEARVRMTPPLARSADLVSWLESSGASSAIVAALLIMLASVWVTLRVRRGLERRAKRRRAVRAQRAERDAAHLLEARGFRLLGRQVRRSWGVRADGADVEFTLIADYLVEQDGRPWVAEVKTGERALDLRHGPTRRQLLEYREAFAVEGVLLVDAEGQTLQSVEFRDRRRSAGTGRALLFTAGVIAGLVAGWLLF
jgi:hypothetical protein